MAYTAHHGHCTTSSPLLNRCTRRLRAAPCVEVGWKMWRSADVLMWSWCVMFAMLSFRFSGSANYLFTFPQTWCIWVITQFSFGLPLLFSFVMFGVAELWMKQMSLIRSVSGALSTCPNKLVVFPSSFCEKLCIWRFFDVIINDLIAFLSIKSSTAP